MANRWDYVCGMSLRKWNFLPKLLQGYSCWLKIMVFVIQSEAFNTQKQVFKSPFFRFLINMKMENNNRETWNNKLRIVFKNKYISSDWIGTQHKLCVFCDVWNRHGIHTKRQRRSTIIIIIYFMVSIVQ